MGYHLNRLDEPVFMAVSKPLLTEFGIHHRLESCEEIFRTLSIDDTNQLTMIFHLDGIHFTGIPCRVAVAVK